MADLHNPSSFAPFASRSLSTSTSWAVGGSANFPDPQPLSTRKRWTPAGLTGAHFADGRIRDDDATHYNSLRHAQAITQSVRRPGGTLHEFHVNLESRVGAMLKRQMGLPYQEHSRVDPQTAADQAARIFGRAWDHATIDGTRVLQGYDHNTAFAGVNPTGLADLELWAHGETGAASRFVANAKGRIQAPVQDLLSMASTQPDLHTIMVRACNEGHHHLQPLNDQRVIYGLGTGFNAPYQGHAIGATAWTDAVVIAEGGERQVYERAALAAYLEKQRPGLARSRGQGTGLISIFRHEGETRLGLGSLTADPKDLLPLSVPLSEAPMKRIQVGGMVKAAVGEEAAVRQAAISTAQATTRATAQVAAHSPAGGYLLAGGLAAIGLGVGALTASMVLKNTDQPNPAMAAQQGRGRDDRRGGGQTLQRVRAGAPKGRTHVRIQDAPLNMPEVDSAFAHHYAHGFAYSS